MRCEGSARAFASVAAIRAMAQALIEPTVISWEGRGQSHFQLAFSYEVGRSVSPQCPLRPPTLLHALWAPRAALPSRRSPSSPRKTGPRFSLPVPPFCNVRRCLQGTNDYSR